MSLKGCRPWWLGRKSRSIGSEVSGFESLPSNSTTLNQKGSSSSSGLVMVEVTKLALMEINNRAIPIEPKVLITKDK